MTALQWKLGSTPAHGLAHNIPQFQFGIDTKLTITVNCIFPPTFCSTWCCALTPRSPINCIRLRSKTGTIYHQQSTIERKRLTKMSGRSAVVRAKVNKQAEKKAQQNEHHGHGQSEFFNHGYATAPDRSNHSATSSYISPPRGNRRRQSISSNGSACAYGYPQPMRKPRPIVIQSAIEKSDFRTHLDGMSSTLRGKLGKLFRGGSSDSSNSGRRPGTSNSKSDSDARSTTRSITFTPSLEAVPSLTSSTSPSEIPSAYQSLRTPTTYSSRSKQQQESVIHKIRRFEGDGKLPQLGWKSLSNVRQSG